MISVGAETSCQQDTADPHDTGEQTQLILTLYDTLKIIITSSSKCNYYTVPCLKMQGIQ